MPDRDKVIKGLKCIKGDLVLCVDCEYSDDNGHGGYHCKAFCANDAIELLKEQEAEIRQLRLALDIAKGTCKGIKSGGGQFADMPTMQSAT